MSNRFLPRAAPGLEKLRPYVPGKPLAALERELGIRDSVKLASNENPLGPSPAVRAALEEVFADLGRYPDGAAYGLREALARRHAVEPACVTLGNGSNDVLDMIARVFLYPGAESLFSEHAFAVYPLSSMAVGASLKVAPARDFGHDLNAMRALLTDRTRVVWIANPNNPTGTWLEERALRSFVEAVPENVILVIDEAYFDYVHEPTYPDASTWLADFPNLVVTRTFSKAYGLAALRVGYGLSHPDIADLLNRVRQPFNVNSLAQAGALAALQDRAHLAESVAVNDRGLRQLADGLGRLGLAFIPSVGNFLAVDVGRAAQDVDQALLHEGVITRPIANYGLAHYLRVSVGLPEENAKCLAALGKVV